MNTVEIPEVSIKLEVPQHWDEIPDDDLQYCFQQAVFAVLGLITPVEAKIRYLYRLLDIQRDWKTVLWERIQSADMVKQKNTNIYLLAEELIGFLFQEIDGKIEVNYNTVMNRFPVLKARRIALYGPGHLLSDLTFGEFRAAIEEMGDFFETRDQECLSRMIACLYRPKRQDLEAAKLRENWDGKSQEPFNRARISDHAKLTAKLGVVHRTAILLWFTHTIGYIQKEDLQLSGRKVNFSLLFPKPAEGETNRKGAGFIGILYGVAETGIFGNAEATDKVGLFDILLYLYDKDIEARKAKAKSQRKGGKTK